ncbi:PorT family protein [Chitinophaga sp. G-6-1-13]|uniref:PorT family protein n=1 Tax=Chitinophaga fulva TaxID=2728842 RepID=A0A848GH58_9BACT|nr:porin family protein [Chitinophaga fulva]NML37157.1 PorT family protein [Chitinophaga fulva]
MKKFLFALLAVTSVATGTYAQKKVNYGLKAGLNLSNSNAQFDDIRAGIFAGGFAEIKLNKHWALQPELVYYRNVSPGLAYFTPDDHVVRAKKKEDFIAIPLMVKYYIKPKLYVEAGPEVNFVLAAKEEGLGHSQNITFLYDRLNVSGSLGVGYQLPHGFGVNARYSLGVQSPGVGPSATTYNNTGKVGITYTFKRK